MEKFNCLQFSFAWFEKEGNRFTNRTEKDDIELFYLTIFIIQIITIELIIGIIQPFKMIEVRKKYKESIIDNFSYP